MSRAQPQVSKILCVNHVRDEPAGKVYEVQACACEDGMLRLFIDGAALPDRVWTASQVEPCMKEFLARCHALRLGKSPGMLSH